ncbi:hypothetical protein EYZ11_011222 [Aspergillus tanneri]|uniref:Uncharacterized protein n=1 Tax=Aspergillus tanneri TaxID=1220188 RepID=A0A4S3J5H5_9EURO|nr:uncharacterized protein ATNIH1004_001703 [Aspergillus tanneri]KAA8652798.1 hypothetical protein ATNIH1004_001703 [Aspergillus tanneri]THC89328.1 hypothetical protein EYZ11_011222 [Aspergillus tanneri]
MDPLQYTDRETQLASERRLKFQGTAKVNLDDIYFPPQTGRQMDQKNVDRLCDVFREDECRNLTIEHRVPAIVSRHHLQAAQEKANVATSMLLTRVESEIPHLQFPPGQLLALHGRHRIAAGREVLPPGHYWWAVDLYLDNIGDDLKTSLIEEYSNEKPPSDGEIYRKIRQYAGDGNLHGELRWKARLCPNSRTRFEALSKNTRLRHAFDRILGIPGHWNAMRISMLHRVIAVRCDEEIAHYLNFLADFWYSLVDHDPASAVRIDQETVQKLQLLAPRIETPYVHGLVLSGQVFSEFDENERTEIWGKLRSFNGLIPSLYSFFEDFKCFESWAHCLHRLFPVSSSTVRLTMEGSRIRPNSGEDMCMVQNSESTFLNRVEPAARHFDIFYRQLWLYAGRHYPQMPREPKRKNRLAKPGSATADACVVAEMARLASRLGFKSDRITQLVNQSSDRLIAAEALRRARKPDQYVYDESSFNSSVDQIVDCFATATPRTIETASPVLASPSVRPKARCGHPSVKALLQDRQFLFLDQMHAPEVPDRVTSRFVRRCVYLAFFGPRTDFGQEQQISPLPPPEVPGSGPISPIFIADDGMMDYTLGDGQQQAHARSEDQRQMADLQAVENSCLQRQAEDLACQAREAENTATAHAAQLEQARKEASERAAEQARQDVAMLELARRAEEAESRMAAQAAELDWLRQEAARALADTIKGTSQVDGRPVEDESEIPNDGEVTEEDHDKQPDNTLQADAEQRAIGGWEPSQWDTDRVVRERAGALAQLQSQNQDSRSQPRAEAEPVRAIRPITEFDASSLMATWREPQNQTDINSDSIPPAMPLTEGHMDTTRTGPGSPSEGHTHPQALEVIGHEGPETEAPIPPCGVGEPAIIQMLPEENIIAGNIPSTGAVKQRQRQQAKPGKIQKTSTAKPTARDSNHATLRAEAIDIELDETLESSQSAETTPINEGTARTRQVRFDISHEEGAGHATASGEARSRPVTQWGFRELARNTSVNANEGQGTPDKLEKEIDTRTRRGKIPITFFLYAQNQWKEAKVFEIEPSKPSSLEHAVRIYQQQGMYVYDMKMRTISAPASFRAATCDGCNALLLISRKTRDKMDERRQIQPPTIERRER